MASQITSELNDLLSSNANPSASDIAAALDGLIPGLTVTADGNTITLQASASVSVDPPNAAIDVGGSAVGLTANADFAGAINAALDLKLDYNPATQALAVATNTVDELTLGLDLSADVNATAKLALLDIAVEDNLDDPEIELDFGLDIADGAVSGLGAGSVSVDMEGSAKLDLGLRTDVAILPDLVANLVFDWQFDGATLPSPTVEFKNIGVDIRSLVDQLADVIDPILGIFNEFPLGTIKDALTTQVPSPFSNVLSVLDADQVPAGGDGQVNVLDLAAFYYEKNGNTAAAEQIRVFGQALMIIDQLTGGANDESGAALSPLEVSRSSAALRNHSPRIWTPLRTPTASSPSSSSSSRSWKASKGSSRTPRPRSPVASAIRPGSPSPSSTIRHRSSACSCPAAIRPTILSPSSNTTSRRWWRRPRSTSSSRSSGRSASTSTASSPPASTSRSPTTATGSRIPERTASPPTISSRALS